MKAARFQTSILAMAVAAVIASSGAAQQPNTPAATMVWGTAAGGPYPIVASIDGSHSGSTTVAIGGLANQPFLLAQAPAGVLAQGTPTIGELLDLNMTGGLNIVADGFSFSTGGGLDAYAHVGAGAAFATSVFVVAIQPGGVQYTGAWQALVGDPASLYGYHLTAATDLTLAPAPAAAIYVSSTLGSPTNPGTRAAPLPTITAGIAASLAGGPPYAPVFVAIGIYNERPVFHDGISVDGGLAAGPTAWTYSGGGRSQIYVGTAPATADGITSPTTISRCDFVADSQVTVGASSIALRADASSNALQFEECRFVAGNGAPGAAGLDGLTAVAGNPGAYLIWYPYIWIAMFGNQFGLGGTGIRPGGNGGDGSPYASPFIGWIYGSPGVAAPFGGGAGGNPGMAVHFPPNAWISYGGPGHDGANGNDGNNGAAGLPIGTIASGLWVAGAAAAGTDGDPGLGGGGGGGEASAGQGTTTGHCGGGGGAGGEGGHRGGGGGNGGASIALLLVNASPRLVQCAITSALGGSGGHGGAGNTGGAGGIGGSAPVGVTQGGPGGLGGLGGAGGGGGGGAGGPSWCVMRAGNSAPIVLSSTYFIGPGGALGLGGLHGNGQSYAPAGAVGPSAALY